MPACPTCLPQVEVGSDIWWVGQAGDE